jgi:hypothetical protein
LIGKNFKSVSIFSQSSENLKIFLCKIQPKCGIIKHKDYCNERESYDR